jgi:hypothetical protein
MNLKRTVKGRIYSKMQKLGLLDVKDGQYFKIENEPYMALHVERHDNEIFLSHTYLQYGDVMDDPHMRVMFNDALEAASAVFFNSHASRIEVVIRGTFYREDGSEFLGINQKAEKDFNQFLLQWLDNIRDQGFDIKGAIRGKSQQLLA